MEGVDELEVLLIGGGGFDAYAFHDGVFALVVLGVDFAVVTVNDVDVVVDDQIPFEPVPLVSV